MSDEQAQVRISVENRFESVDVVLATVGEAMTRLGLDEDSRHWLEIAIREVMADALKYDNERDWRAKITVELAMAGDQAILRVHDRGKDFFDPEEEEDPLARARLLKHRRLKGRWRDHSILSKFVDELEYGAGPGGGTMLTVKKRATV